MSDKVNDAHVRIARVGTQFVIESLCVAQAKKPCCQRYHCMIRERVGNLQSDLRKVDGAWAAAVVACAMFHEEEKE